MTTFIIKPLVAASALGVISALGLVACKTDSGNTVASEPKASLNVAAQFPTAGQPGQVGAAMIDENTAIIYVSVCDSTTQQQETMNCQDATLTKDSPSTEFTNLTLHDKWVRIWTYDATEQPLDYMEVGAKLSEGQNTLTATLIRAKWTLASAITLNKTRAGSVERLDSFSVLGGYGNGYGWDFARPTAAVVDITRPIGMAYYSSLWRGVNLYDTVTEQNTRDSLVSELDYFNQFVGPGTNSNAVDGAEIELTPDPDFPDSTDCLQDTITCSNRWATIIGLLNDPEENGTFTFSDPAVNNINLTRVTGAKTMQGTILEALEKSSTNSMTCYAGTNNTAPVIACPWTDAAPTAIVAARVKNKRNAVARAASTQGQAGKAAADANGCFKDLTMTITGSYSTTWDLNGDNIWNEPLFVQGVNVWTGDACLHPFTATASQIPSTDISVLVQSASRRK